MNSMTIPVDREKGLNYEKKPDHLDMPMGIVADWNQHPGRCGKLWIVRGFDACSDIFSVVSAGGIYSVSYLSEH